MRNVSDKFAQKIKTYLRSVNFFFENRAVCEVMWKNMVQPDRPRMTVQYGVCALHAGYLRLQKHTQICNKTLLSHGDNGYTNAPQCYVTR
jgi:hypothetical protein